MRTRNEFVELMQKSAPELRKRFGILNMRLFGSVARNEHHEGSDLDLLVDTETPNPFLLMDAKDYLEQITNNSVDMVRNHRHLNPKLRKRIERDGILVF